MTPRILFPFWVEVAQLDAVDGAHFGVWAPNAERVSVVGDFNNWSATEDAKLECDNGVWRRQFNLKPGTYKYRLIVDGKWQEDPDNPKAEQNPFGELDSILEVAE